MNRSLPLPTFLRSSPRGVLAAILVTALAGCGGGGGQSTTASEAPGPNAEIGTLPDEAAAIMGSPVCVGTMAVLRGRRRERRGAARQPGRRAGVHGVDGKRVLRRLGLRHARHRHTIDDARLRHDADQRRRRRRGPGAGGVRRSGARRAQRDGGPVRPHLRRRHRRSRLRRLRAERGAGRRPAGRSRRPRPADRRTRVSVASTATS